MLNSLLVSVQVEYLDDQVFSLVKLNHVSNPVDAKCHITVFFVIVPFYQLDHIAFIQLY